MKIKIMVILFLVIIYGFFFLNIIMPDKDVSNSDKRGIREVSGRGIRKRRYK